MRFFIDTANLDEIREGLDMGLVDGVTTNPSLVAKEGGNFEVRAKEILKIVPGPVSLEAVSLTAGEMVEEAKHLASWGDNVVVKLPCVVEALKATRRLAEEGIAVNITLVFNATQALLAAKAGAAYVSPFVGRLDDISTPGMDMVEEIIAIYDNYGYETEVIVASVRNPVHVLQAALMGADVATVPFKVLKQLAAHPLTDVGLAKFLADWEKLKQG
ncbi:MAG: fructose-6-phosphate aldolase [Deltaproteobacteria bacterium]|nr:fructose-6-phosphate aldolase [Deltaproteobacteria bacterium]